MQQCCKCIDLFINLQLLSNQMKTFVLAIIANLLHVVCCIFPMTLLGFNTLTFLNLSTTTKHTFLGIQLLVFLYLSIKICRNYQRKIKFSLEILLTWLSIILIIFSFYVNFYEPFHTEEQKMMKERIERLKNE